MIIIDTVNIGKTTYNVYMGSHENKYIFNVVDASQDKPSGGYPNLRYICEIKEFSPKQISTSVFKAERIMGKTIKENLEVRN